MVGAFASAAVVQSKMNASGGSNGTYYKTLMDAATLLYSTVSHSLVPRRTSAYREDCDFRALTEN